jgi:hypothetical protein
MEENLQILYENLGGDAQFGNIENFKTGLQNPDNLNIAYQNAGGDKQFQNIGNFRTGLGLQSAPVTKSEYVQTETKGFFRGLADYTWGLIESSWEQGRQAEVLETLDFATGARSFGDLSKDEVQILVDSRRKQQDAQKRMEGFEGVFRPGDFLDKTEEWTGKILSSLVGSVTSQVSAASQEGDGIVMVGSGIAGGAALGSAGFVTGPGGIATTIGGAVSGGKMALTTAMIAAGADVEFAGTLMSEAEKYAKANNIDMDDPEQLLAMFKNEEFSVPALKKATLGTAIVTAAEVATLGLGRKFFPDGITDDLVRNANAQDVLRAIETDDFLSAAAKQKMGRAVLEATGGASGELGKQLATNGEGEKLNWEAVILEGAAGIPGVILETGFDQINNITNSVRGNRARNEIIAGAEGANLEEFSNGVDLLQKAGGISEESANMLKQEFEAVREIFTSIPNDEVSGKVQRNEMVQAIVDRMEIDQAIDTQRKKIEGSDETLRPVIQQKIDRLTDAREKLNGFISKTAGATEANIADYNAKNKIISRVYEEVGTKPTRDAVSVQGGEVTVADDLPQNIRDSVKEQANFLGLTYKEAEGVKPVEAEPVQETEPTGETVATSPEPATTEGVEPDAAQPTETAQTPEAPAEQPREKVKTPEQIRTETEQVFAAEQQRLSEVEAELGQLFEEFQSNERLEELAEEGGGILQVIDSDADLTTSKGKASAFKNMGNVSKKQADIFGAEKVARAKELTSEYRSLNEKLVPQERTRRMDEALKREQARPVASKEMKSAARDMVRASNDVAKARVKPGTKALESQVETARKSLEGTNVTIELLSDKDFTARRGKSAKGSYITDRKTGNRTILINRDKAGKNTLAHELAHAAIMDTLGERDVKVTQFAESLRAALKNGDNYEQQLLREIDAVVDKYANTGLTDVRGHEFLAELASVLATNGTRIKKRTGLAQKIVDAINESIAAIIGKRPIKNVKDVNEAVQFINELADKLADNRAVENTGTKPATDSKKKIETETFESLNRDTKRRDEFVRELQRKFPDLTTEELTEVLNKEGVKVDAQQVRDIIANKEAAKDLSDIFQVEYGASVANSSVERVLDFLGKDLPERMSGSMAQGLRIASNHGYISEGFVVEEGIAATVMSGEGINEYQSLALGHALIRTKQKIAELAAMAEEAGTLSSSKINMDLDNAKAMFEMFAIAYAKAGNQSARMMAFRGALKFDDQGSRPLVGWKKEFEESLNTKDKKVYDDLVKLLGLEEKQFSKLVENTSAVESKHIQQLAKEQLESIAKEKRGPKEDRQTLIDNILKAYSESQQDSGSKQETIYDSIDPNENNDINKYRALYKFVRHLVKKEGYTDLANIIAEILRLDPSIQDVDVMNCLVLANRQNNDGKVDVFAQRMARIRNQRRLAVKLEEFLRDNPSDKRLTTKKFDQFIRMVGQIMKNFRDDADSDLGPIDSSATALDALSKALHLMGEATKVNNPELAQRAYDLMDAQMFTEKAKQIRSLDDRLAKLQDDMKELESGGIPDTKHRGVKRLADAEVMRKSDMLKQLRAKILYFQQKAMFEADLEKRFPLKNAKGAKRMYLVTRHATAKMYEQRGEFWELPRAIGFSFDASMAFLQAGFDIMASVGAIPSELFFRKKPHGGHKFSFQTHMVNLYKAFAITARDAWASGTTNSEDLYYSIISSDAGRDAQLYGVDFSKPGDPTSAEEMFRSKLVKSLPLGIGWGVGVSENLFVNYMNMTRIHAFTLMKEGNPNLDVSQYKQLAQFINDSTGRSVPDGPISKGIAGASKILAAPRLYVSRWRMGVTTLPTALFRVAASGFKDPASAHIVKMYAKYAAGMAATYLALNMAGWELEDDPNHKAFLKFRNGEQVIDISSGMLKFTKIPVMIGNNVYKNEYGKRLVPLNVVTEQGASMKTFSGDMLNLTKYSLHPQINAVWNAVDQSNTIKIPLGTSNLHRLRNWFAMTYAPIPLQGAFVKPNQLLARDYTNLTKEQMDLLGEFDKPEQKGYVKRATDTGLKFFGLGLLDYNNKLDDKRVEDWMIKNKKIIEVTKREASKYIRLDGSPVALDESANTKGILDGYKKDCEDLIGAWMLTRIEEKDPPTQAEVDSYKHQVARAMGEIYGKQFFTQADIDAMMETENFEFE